VFNIPDYILYPICLWCKQKILSHINRFRIINYFFQNLEKLLRWVVWKRYNTHFIRFFVIHVIFDNARHTIFLFSKSIKTLIGIFKSYINYHFNKRNWLTISWYLNVPVEWTNVRVPICLTLAAWPIQLFKRSVQYKLCNIM
jgi:hypothetical protein